MKFAREHAALLLLLLLFQTAHAQRLKVTRIDPPNWWTGMRSNQVQLMVYGENLGSVSAQFHSPQVRVLRTYRCSNPSYAFVDIEISPDALDGAYLLTFTGLGDTVSVNYPLLPREPRAGRYQGFSSSDAVYLIVPDRFADGDTANDRVAGMLEGTMPDSAFGRHGGDLQGVLDHLDYLADLGVTALWLTPLVENNNPGSTYHGYAATDLYRIDPRFGTNDLYREVVSEAHKRGLKVLMDHVSNHVGINHPWVRNPPSPTWFNGSVLHHTRTMHYKLELLDPYSDSTLRENTIHGWFSDNMPDLNQANPFVSRYLVQNTIWWIESAGIDGIREDTSPYVEPRYLSEWSAAIFREYPSFNIVGEFWIDDPVFLAPFQTGSCLSRNSEAHLPSLTDYGLYDALMQVFANRASIRILHECLAKDFLYPDPSALLTFVDNHDVRRIMNDVQGDSRKARMALTMLLTLRGIPEILYGTELGLMGGKDHGTIRCNFPGGFAGDQRDAFKPEGRTPREALWFAYVRQLLHLRKDHPALTRGRMVDFPPVNEAYAYVHSTDNERLMVVVNNRDERQQVSLAPYRHQLGDAKLLRNLTSGKDVDLTTTSEIELDGTDAEVYLVVPAGKP